MKVSVKSPARNYNSKSETSSAKEFTIQNPRRARDFLFQASLLTDEGKIQNGRRWI